MVLATWSWIFLVLYIGVMLGFGYIASKRIRDADDFATARGSYGPVFLAFAFAATIASGGTFLGLPGLAYEFGMPAVLGGFLYPIGAYFGVLISMRLITTSGNRFGNRSIPEYLGDRYQSEGIRVLVSIFSLMLFFYLAAQLVSGLVMFEIMLGLSQEWALGITTLVMLIYVTMGGAHADILTDGVQGFVMLVIAVVVIFLFFFGTGFEDPHLPLLVVAGGLAAQPYSAGASPTSGKQAVGTPRRSRPVSLREARFLHWDHPGDAVFGRDLGTWTLRRRSSG